MHLISMISVFILACIYFPFAIFVSCRAHLVYVVMIPSYFAFKKSYFSLQIF